MTQVKFAIRHATIADTPAIFSLILALADYENLSDKVTGNIESLQEDLFGAKPCIEAIVVEIEPNQQIVGFALFFTSYSTFLTRRGIYLEDLFVLSEYRGMGIGKALIPNHKREATDRASSIESLPTREAMTDLVISERRFLTKSLNSSIFLGKVNRKPCFKCNQTRSIGFNSGE